MPSCWRPGRDGSSEIRRVHRRRTDRSRQKEPGAPESRRPRRPRRSSTRSRPTCARPYCRPICRTAFAKWVSSRPVFPPSGSARSCAAITKFGARSLARIIFAPINTASVTSRGAAPHRFRRRSQRNSTQWKRTVPGFAKRLIAHHGTPGQTRTNGRRLPFVNEPDQCRRRFRSLRIAASSAVASVSHAVAFANSKFDSHLPPRILSLDLDVRGLYHRTIASDLTADHLCKLFAGISKRLDPGGE